MERIVKPPEERKKELVEMAKKLFSERGYEKTKISDITQALNVSHGLIHHYFKSKADVFDAVIDNILEDKLAIVSEAANNHKMSFNEKLEKIFTLITKQSYDQKGIFTAIYTGGNEELLYRVARRKVARFAPLLEQMIKDGHEKGELDCPNPKATAWFCMYGEFGMMNIYTEDMKLEEMIGEIKEMYARALGLKKKESIPCQN